MLESQGIPAISASGSGRFFKSREWGPLLQRISEVVLAYRRGDREERHKYLLSRGEVRRRARRTVPHAHLLQWPAAVGSDGGAFVFFAENRRTIVDFERLLPDS
ncbi:MAG: hypothetical protein IH936_04890 [Acidobacteria bacterium]|nr:hypothetical protein [Acidobacteriota bacterium]